MLYKIKGLNYLEMFNRDKVLVNINMDRVLWNGIFEKVEKVEIIKFVLSYLKFRVEYFFLNVLDF